MASRNAELAKRFHEDIFERGDFDAADQILTKDFVTHSPGAPADFLHGPDGAKEYARAIRAGLPDLSITHDDIVIEGDKVVIRWSATGTHKGELLGIPPTGKPVEITGFDLFRIEGDRIAEMWQNWDALGLMQQVGAIPAPQ
jgi:steroid delta-isomerase-like uncharacterized protein